MTGTGKHRSEASQSTGSLLARSLRTAANAAAEVLEQCVNDLHASGDHYYFDPGLDPAQSYNEVTSHPASSSPGLRGASNSYQNQPKSSTLRPAMAKRLVELTTLSDSSQAFPRQKHSSGPNGAEADHCASLEWTSVTQESTRHLPLDTLMQLRHKPSSCGAQVSSQVSPLSRPGLSQKMCKCA